MDLGGSAPLLETGITWRSTDTTPTIARFLEIAGDIVAERRPSGRPARER
jgi:hypothetical protein